MNKQIVISVLAAAAMASAIPASAQDQYRGARDAHGQQQRDSMRAQDRTEGNFGRTEDFSAGYDGAGPNHNLRRGEPLPGRYRTHQYVVDQWRTHHLSRPPQGYSWIQAGADYVLVDTGTGTISQVVRGH